MSTMRNGMMILEQTDTKQQAVFIEEEQLDWLRLHAMFKKRDKERAVVEREHHAKESRKRAWKRYTIKTFSFIGVRTALVVATVWTMVANFVHPIVGIPVALYCLITACIRFGMWFEKWINRKS